MNYFVKTLLPRLVQDALTAGAATLASHGLITADQTQGFIGAGFFLVMLVVNRFLGDTRLNAAAVKGAEAVADHVTETVPAPLVKSLAKDALK